MDEEVGAVAQESTILDEVEVNSILNEGDEEGAPAEEEVQLPSDEEDFVLPEKFAGKSAEDIAKAYAELEKKLSSKETDEQTDENPPEDTPEDTQKEEDKPEKQEVSAEELSDLNAQVFKDGDLTEEQYADLEARGYDRKEVEEQVNYVKYQQAQEVSKIVSPVFGDTAAFQEAGKWAAENWSADEVADFNAAVAESSGKVQQQVLRRLADAYKKGNTESEPRTPIHTNKSNKPKTVSGYQTKSAMMRDMSDPRYESDKSFNDAVAAKVAKTDMDSWY